MPSLSTKVEPAMATDPAECSKTFVVMMEKKIRNLEKRKTKLEDYQKKQSRGQDLTDEQLKAVAKLDDVLSQIELLQDLIKQVNTYGAEVMKQQKKVQKRERFEQIENERRRFAELLHLQSVLNALGDGETRQAFSEGSAGAVKLEEQELSHLEELYKIINPERCADMSLAAVAKSSAEHLQFVLDGRDKAICGTTYRSLNDTIAKIKDCSFFTESKVTTSNEKSQEISDTATEKEFIIVQSEELPPPNSEEVIASLPPELPVEQPVAASEQVYQPQMEGVVPPSDSKTLEDIVENVQGTFKFIQDSELDADSPSNVDPAVVSVHQMPHQHYQQQPMVSHSQPENSGYTQPNGVFQQYSMTSAPNPAVVYPSADAPHNLPMPNEAPSQVHMYSSQPEPTEEEHPTNFANGVTFESSVIKQQQQEKGSHADGDYQQRGHGQVRRGGGNRGGRGGYSNGYNGPRGGFRGSDRPSGYRGGDRQSGGDRSYHSGNGFQSDSRRGGRNTSRGGSGGYRGSSSTYSNSNRSRGGFRSSQQQQPPINISIMESELKIDLSGISGEEEVSDTDRDEDTKITSDSAIDELMSALDVLEGHADDSIQVSRNTEMYWITTLNERDELILSNKKSISELQRINDKLREENQMLRQQLSLTDRSEVVSALQDDAAQSRSLSMQLQAELAALQLDVVSRLKDQNSELQARLVKCGKNYSEVFNRLRQKQRQHPKLSKLAADLEKQTVGLNAEEKKGLKKQVEDLCDAYDEIITEACDECEKQLQSVETLEDENSQISARERALTSPKRSRPASSLETDKYYSQLLQMSENSNSELRKEVERLHKEMNSREQKLFDDSMVRAEYSNREQIDKMKSQISELSQEMSLLNVDNRALRERILRTENENEILGKKVKDSVMADEELNALQSNLDSQLDLNHQLEGKVKQLELIRKEHESICLSIKSELATANDAARRYNEELLEISEQLRSAKELNQSYDSIIGELGDKLKSVRIENVHLTEKIKHVEHVLSESQAQRDIRDQQESRTLEDITAQLENLKEKHHHEVKMIEEKLQSTEKQRENANMKVKALRERLKNMQDSWQKISGNTETSFSALRDQYQQQIKEYKSIVQSLKSQNASLNIRIDSLKKISSQHNASQVSSLEQQIAEYKQITSGYREENVLLRKELRTIVLELQSQGLSEACESKPVNSDEFAKLRDILTTAKSECENLQLHKTPRSRASSVERKANFTEERSGSVEKSYSFVGKISDSVERRAGSVERRAGSIERRDGSVERSSGSSEKRAGSVERRVCSIERRTGSVERSADPAERRDGSVERSQSAARRSSSVERKAVPVETNATSILQKNRDWDISYAGKHATKSLNSTYKDKYNSLSPTKSDNLETKVSPRKQPVFENDPQHTPSTRYKVLNDPASLSASQEEREPLAISTPRKVNPAEYKSLLHSGAYGMRTQRSVGKYLEPLAKISTTTSGASLSMTVPTPTLYGNMATRSEQREHSGKSMLVSRLSNSSDATTLNSKSFNINSKQPLQSQEERSVHSNTMSKTKEVVEIKDQNSAEIDPSKSFKPINPDDDTVPQSCGSTLASGKPLHVTSTQRYYSSNSISSRYDMPFRSKYDVYSHRSKYHTDKSPGEDYKNTSTDSAYGSPSRSFSKAPSVASYTSSYHKSHTLPSLYTNKSSSSIEPRDSLTKLLDYEIEQTSLLNRTLDDLEVSMDSVSSLTNRDLQRLNSRPSESEKNYSRNYKKPPTHSIYLSAPARKYVPTNPKRIDFYGTVVYESMYR
ncbi:uncharacterized protein [Watersipora subatra]|uniref:uncharacterized protein n=1 Tax=Watersipora subatra TaxID=2589382 RepID=UPI00355BE981